MGYYYRDEVVPVVKTFDRKLWFVLGLTILLATFVSSAIGYKLLERNDAYIVSGLSLIGPLFTVLFAWYFLNETINCKGLLGILIMLFGSWLIIQAKREADA